MIDPLDLGLITTEGDGIYLSSACDEFNNSKPFWNVLDKTGWLPDEYLKELKKRTGNDR